MKIPVTLNGDRTVLDAEPAERLQTTLRRLNLFSIKLGCSKGICGNCMVLLDGEPVPSCTLPVGILRDCSIVTLEYFSKSEPIYNDIINGFRQAGIHLCGYCNAGKILSAYRVLTEPVIPDDEEILDAVRALNPCCTDRDSLIHGIKLAYAIKQNREGKHSNG
ncbi:MAG: 2Fe-2S iron-sulfur cluster binding domain-containing protein [Treponema sp.]|nr:2Fe-2S iron-sulfur cluster binding domain-containing protein [Treponema sp.]